MGKDRPRQEGPFPVALVSGASSGIGAATARVLAKAGYRVVALARRRGHLAALAAESDAIHPLALDLRDGGALAGLTDALPEPLRQIDLLVNSAGHDVGGGVAFAEGAIDDWISGIEVNVAGLMRLTHAVAPGMAARGRGDIVNIGSITAWQTAPRLAAYTAAKHAVHGFSLALRADFAGSGVRVVEIMPGVVKSGFAESRLRGDAEQAARFYESFGDTLSPDDVANAVLWAVGQPPEVQVEEIRLTPTFGKPR